MQEDVQPPKPFWTNLSLAASFEEVLEVRPFKEMGLQFDWTTASVTGEIDFLAEVLPGIFTPLVQPDGTTLVKFPISGANGNELVLLLKLAAIDKLKVRFTKTGGTTGTINAAYGRLGLV